MARKNTTRLTIECLETRDAPSAQPLMVSILPAMPVFVATQATIQTTTAPAMQTQTLATVTKVQASPATTLLPAHVVDAIGIGYSAGIAGMRMNHNQILVRIGARKRGRKS